MVYKPKKKYQVSDKFDGLEGNVLTVGQVMSYLVSSCLSQLLVTYFNYI